MGVITQLLALRKGRMEQIVNHGTGWVRLDYLVPARGLIGFRTELLTETRGTALLHHVFETFEPWAGAIRARVRGSLVADRLGPTTGYSLMSLQERGQLFVGPGEVVYEGMIVGENARADDMDVNPTKEKKLTNVRSNADSFEKLIPPKPMSLEQALEFIADDECVEVTPAVGAAAQDRVRPDRARPGRQAGQGRRTGLTRPIRRSLGDDGGRAQALVPVRARRRPAGRRRVQRRRRRRPGDAAASGRADDRRRRRAPTARPTSTRPATTIAARRRRRCRSTPASSACSTPPSTPEGTDRPRRRARPRRGGVRTAPGRGAGAGTARRRRAGAAHRAADRRRADPRAADGGRRHRRPAGHAAGRGRDVAEPADAPAAAGGRHPVAGDVRADGRGRADRRSSSCRSTTATARTTSRRRARSRRRSSSATARTWSAGSASTAPRRRRPTRRSSRRWPARRSTAGSTAAPTLGADVPAWVVEGAAAYAADRVAGPTSVTAAAWQRWVGQPQRPLTARTYRRRSGSSPSSTRPPIRSPSPPPCSATRASTACGGGSSRPTSSTGGAGSTRRSPTGRAASRSRRRAPPG